MAARTIADRFPAETVLSAPPTEVLPAPGPGVRASVSHLADLLTHKEWGPATIAVAGLEEFPVSGGGGQRVVGDPITFVLVASGRREASALGLDPGVNVYG